jgi:hypothetical protein
MLRSFVHYYHLCIIVTIVRIVVCVQVGRGLVLSRGVSLTIVGLFC